VKKLRKFARIRKLANPPSARSPSGISDSEWDVVVLFEYPATSLRATLPRFNEIHDDLSASARSPTCHSFRRRGTSQ
jgi:hypothetical protein